MGESEPLDKNVKAAELALKAEEVRSKKKRPRLATALPWMKRLPNELRKERAEIVAGVTSSVYNRYEHVRKARRGIAVAEAADGRRTACQMAMRPQFFQELKRGDSVMACESCLRIPYYNPPVKFEDLTGEPHPRCGRRRIPVRPPYWPPNVYPTHTVSSVTR